MPTHAPDVRPDGADLKIVNARLVTPAGVQDGAVAVRDGVIVAIGDAADLPDARETIDARGRYVLPGIVDPEAHPGHSHPLRDVVPSESRAAVASGVTTWGIQNPAPRFGQEPWKQESGPEDVVSFFEVFEKGLGIWSELAHTDFFFTFQIETDEQAEEIPRYARELGVPSVKFYCHTQRMANDSFWFANGTGLARGFDDGTLYLACERAAEVGGMVHIHPENWEVARVLEKRLLAAGRDDMGAWDDRSPWFAEAHHVRQFSYFALITGATMYVQHTTNPLTLREIRRAREEGVRIYSQTGAPWLYFTRDDWRINTPLRSREAVEALWEALADGTVDLVGSDHVVARGRREEMAAEGVWSRKKSGFPSRVEMLLPIMLSEGVNKGRIGIERLVEVCASTPAKIFGLWPRKGAIAVGSDADFVIVDLDREVEVRDEMVHTLPGWTLLHGHRLTGWPVMTILRGRVVAEWKDGEPRTEVLGEPDGRHLAPGTDNIVHTRPVGPRPYGSQAAV
ncbi:MAG TPA: amidohydrolase family protein [Candidatus Limnocylindria bacterium]|nr:amidohydrolase family protein [Candidatus Limnocylindria bacterium]